MQGQALRLDRTRKHSSVHGEVEYGLAYKQDGLPFDNQGELIKELVTTPEQKALVEKKLRRLAKVAMPKEAPPAELPKEPAAITTDDDDDDKGSDDDVNFDAWARGMERVEWNTLQRVARKRFNKVFKSKDDIVEFLVFDEKVLALEDVAPALRPKSEAA